MSSAYPPPVDRLLTLPGTLFGEWPHYVEELGLTAADIPALLMLATDRALLDLPEDDAGLLAPVHACRALAQLRATEAIAPFIHLLLTDGDTDWVPVTLPRAFGLIGLPAYAPLDALLSDPTCDPWTRGLAGDGLQEIAEEWPAARGRCIGRLHRQLEQFAEQSPLFNASLIGSLTDLAAEGAVPTIARVFAAGMVDEQYIIWDEILTAFGPAAERWGDFS